MLLGEKKRKHLLSTTFTWIDTRTNDAVGGRPLSCFCAYFLLSETKSSSQDMHAKATHASFFKHFPTFLQTALVFGDANHLTGLSCKELHGVSNAKLDQLLILLPRGK